MIDLRSYTNNLSSYAVLKFEPGFNFTTAEVVCITEMTNVIYISINTVTILILRQCLRPTDLTALLHPRSPQTYNYVATFTDQQQTENSMQDQMIRLPGTRDWWNTNEPPEMAMPTITMLYIIN